MRIKDVKYNFMNEHVKKFIENNIDLIEKEYWEILYSSSKQHEFYKGVEINWDHRIFGEVTQVLHEAGIYPEYALTYIPENFLHNVLDTHIDEYKVPQNIIEIRKAAFANTDIKKVYIPDGVKIIEAGAFKNCTDLKEIYIGSGVEYIGDKCFQDCRNLTKIIYNGNKEQWHQIKKGTYVFRMAAQHYIKYLK